MQTFLLNSSSWTSLNLEGIRDACHDGDCCASSAPPLVPSSQPKDNRRLPFLALLQPAPSSSSTSETMMDACPEVCLERLMGEGKPAAGSRSSPRSGDRRLGRPADGEASRTGESSRMAWGGISANSTLGVDCLDASMGEGCAGPASGEDCLEKPRGPTAGDSAAAAHGEDCLEKARGPTLGDPFSDISGVFTIVEFCASIQMRASGSSSWPHVMSVNPNFSYHRTRSSSAASRETQAHLDFGMRCALDIAHLTRRPP
mmetsp:Transcript_96762/g.252211  ORF Transcript_96762/g.252211 Transcript_96762/m.252211 type:complete len:258 (-) Transcript_96762:599-1372(-)